MKINVNQQNDQTVIALDGMLDSTSVPQVQEAINQVINTPTTPNVVLDLSHLAYISSQGVRVILTLIRAIRATQGRLIFRNIQPPVREIFDLSGLSQAMVIE